METNTLYHGDCLELMPQIEDHSIDMILCDLPYGVTLGGCKWDVIIPFEPLWDAYKRIIKPNGVIVLTATQPFTSLLIVSNLKMFKYCWVWVKSKKSNFTNVKHQPLRECEDVAVFYNEKPTYNPQGIIHNPKQQKRAKTTGENYFQPATDDGREYIQEYENWPSQILKFNSEGKTIHPTQKPVDLFEYLIRTYTNENELVLDNCAGSGTTAIASMNTSRKWICIEKDDIHYPNALKRIKKHTPTFGF